MKTYGLKETQELVSIILDSEGNPKLESLRPREVDEATWIPPTIIPLVKLDKPTIDILTQYVEPKLVWFNDRVERQWEIKEIAVNNDEEALKAAKLANAEKQRIIKDKRAQMAVDYDALPLSAQTVFWPTRIAVEAALDKGRLDIAIGLVQSVNVPAELQVVKDGILAKLNTL